MADLGRVGKYELLKRLAVGGMAEIFLSRQTGVEGFQKLVVIKKILPHLAAQERFVQMFLNEARLAARFNHPNIVQIYDLGQEDDVFYIAMEYVHGEDIKSVVRRCASMQRRVPLEHVVKLFSGVLDGLHYAHTQTDLEGKPGGVVHRDVSPHNIIVSFQGGVKLVDFGIAKARSQISTTIPGRVKGKHAYMSPEQCQGLEIDGRSDIFSVGIVIYELITWSRLFKRKHDLETLRAITMGEIPPPRSLRQDLDPTLEAIILKALAQEREQRYQTAQEMQMALEDYLVNKGLKSNSVLISRFMEELFADKVALRTKALNEAKAENLEKAVLQSRGEGGPDLVAFLNMFFGDSTSASESTGSGGSSAAHPQQGPEFTPTGDFTPPPGSGGVPRPITKPVIPAPIRRDASGGPIRPPPPRAPEDAGDVVHVAPGRNKPGFINQASTKPTMPVTSAPAGPVATPAGPPPDPASILDTGMPAQWPPPDASACMEPADLLREVDPFASKPKQGKGLLWVAVIGILVVAGVLLFVILGKGMNKPPPKGTVKITSIPDGADVYLDDIHQDGKTPLELQLKPGEEHLLRVEHSDYPPWEQKFTISDIAKPLEFNPIFDKEAASKIKVAGAPIAAEAEGQGRGTIKVESDPPGALIYLDGVSTTKKAPATLRAVPATLDHVVLLEIEGKDAPAKRFHLDPDQEVRVQLKLQDVGPQAETRTAVRFESEPEGAKVTVNEWPMSKTTPIPVKLLDGAYSDVSVELPGYQKWTRVVRPVPGVELTFFAKLKKK